MLLCAYVLKELFDSTQVSVLNCIAVRQSTPRKKEVTQRKINIYLIPAQAV
jgi:hypothetical protein